MHEVWIHKRPETAYKKVNNMLFIIQVKGPANIGFLYLIHTSPQVGEDEKTNTPFDERWGESINNGKSFFKRPWKQEKVRYIR